MKKRSIIILIIIIAVLIIGGIGFWAFNSGKLAGLADVVLQQTGGGIITVRIEVKDTQGNPVPGVLVYMTNPSTSDPSYDKQRVNGCSPGDTVANWNPILRSGITETHNDNWITNEQGIAEFNIYDANNLRYLRVAKEPAGYKSCAFEANYKSVSPAAGQIAYQQGFTDANGANQNFVVFFRDINSEINRTINIRYQLQGAGGGGTEPPVADTGTITGYVKTTGPNGQPIGVAGVRATTEGSKSDTTDSNGKYTISGLTKRATQPYIVKFSYDWSCNFTAPNDLPVIVNATQVSADDIILVQGGVPAGQGKIIGQIKSDTNAPISMARVKVGAGPAALPVLPDVETDNNGYYSFCPLPPLPPVSSPNSTDRYTINVSASGYELGHQGGISISPDQTKTVNLTLSERVTPPVSETFNISGVVKDATTQEAINGATVTLYDQASGEPIRKTNSDGSIGEIVSTITSRQAGPSGQIADGTFNLTGISINLNPSYLKASKSSSRYIDGYKFIEGGTRQIGVTVDYSTNPIYLVRDFEQAVSISGNINLTVEGTASELSGDSAKIFAVRRSDNSRKDLGQSAAFGSDAHQRVAFPGSGQITVPVEYLGTEIKICAEVDKNNKKYVGCHRALGASDDWILIMPGNPAFVLPNGQTNAFEMTLNIKIVVNEVKVSDRLTKEPIAGANVAVEVIKNDKIITPPAKIELKTSAGGDPPAGIARFDIPGEINFQEALYGYKITVSAGDQYISEIKTFYTNTGQIYQIPFELARTGAPTGKVKVTLDVYEQLTGISQAGKDSAHNYWIGYLSGVSDRNGFVAKLKDGMIQFLGDPSKEPMVTLLGRFGVSGTNLPAIIQTIIDQYKIDITTDVPTPFIKQDLSLFSMDGKVRDGMFRKTRWAINHASTTGVVWDEKMDIGKGNPTSTYEIYVDNSNLPANFQTMIATEKEKALARFFSEQQLTINPDGDAGFAFSPGDVYKPTEWGVECGQQVISNTLECHVRILFRMTISSDFLKRMERGVRFIIIPSQRQTTSTDRGLSTASTNIESLTTDKISSILPVSTIGLEIKQTSGGSYLNNYPFLNTLFVGDLTNGNYQLRTVAPNANLFKVDKRANTFNLADTNATTNIETKLCYGEEYYHESGRYKILGPYSSGFYTLLTSATNLASASISKAGIANIVYSGNSDKYSSYYATTPINFCRIFRGNSIDDSIQGRSVVISDGLLNDIWRDNYGSSYNQRRDVAAVLNYKSAQVLHNNELKQVSRESWNNIIRAANLEGDEGTKIFAYLSEASGISGYFPADYAVYPEKAYAVTVSALDNATLLEMKMGQLNNRGKNILKAMLQFAERTVNDKNKYTTAIDISITPTTPNRIALGVWLQENYKNLPINQKIALKYTELIAKIRAGGAINTLIRSFNNLVDRLLGARDTGSVSGTVMQGGQPMKNVIVTIGNEKVGRTDSQGRFTINRITVGSREITIKNKDTGKLYILRNPGLTVNVRKGITTTIIVRVNPEQ